jgi:hypothetical protein
VNYAVQVPVPDHRERSRSSIHPPTPSYAAAS